MEPLIRKYDFCQNQKSVNIWEVIENLGDDFKTNYLCKPLVLGCLQIRSEKLRFWTINPNQLIIKKKPTSWKRGVAGWPFMTLNRFLKNINQPEATCICWQSYYKITDYDFFFSLVFVSVCIRLYLFVTVCICSPESFCRCYPLGCCPSEKLDPTKF